VLLFPQVTFVQRSPFKEVKQGSSGLITKFGKFVRAIDPGLYKINPFWYYVAEASEKLSTVDIRMQVQDIPRQIILTKDNVSITVDSVLYWDILDPYTTTFLVSDPEGAY
jgi:erythrocyte band 7 integral membrane protein